MIFAFAALLAAASAAAPFANAAEADRSALYAHLKKIFSAPPGVVFEVKDVKASLLPDYDAGTLEIRFGEKKQTQPILLSKDGKYYFLSDAFELRPSKIAGFLGPKDGAAPQVHVTQDSRFFLLGDARELAVDPDASILSRISLKGVPSRGPADAPIILVEYSDLQCPFCKRAHKAVSEELEKNYKGRVRWIFKHYPLTNIHDWAYNAAIATSCAYKLKPDAAWKVSESFYEGQETVNAGNIREKAAALAKAAGLDKAKFEACYDKQESKKLVDADIEESNAVGVDSTPTFVIGGRKVVGFRDFAAIRDIIEEKLAEKK